MFYRQRYVDYRMRIDKFGGVVIWLLFGGGIGETKVISYCLAVMKIKKVNMLLFI